jgi:hypothetical protein
MKITLKQKAQVAGHELQAGDYHVSVLPDTQQMILLSGSKELKFNAIRRICRQKIRTADISFYSGGGPTWTILAKVPPNREFLLNITYQ